MPQLVGTTCVRCQEKISNELNARFCGACGNPRHDACAKTPEQLAETLCQECGATIDPAKKSSEPKVPPRSVLRSPEPFPVSEVCPKCNSDKHKKVRPEGWMAFKWDRICKECNTRYTPPTPTWAGVLFILAGTPLMGIGLISVALNALRGNVLSVPAMACEGFLALMGLLAIIHGVRSLSNPGKV